jgi:hypothetical protein
MTTTETAPTAAQIAVALVQMHAGAIEHIATRSDLTEPQKLAAIERARGIYLNASKK